MRLTLNLDSGKLHLSQRCAGPDHRPVRQYQFTLAPGEELLGFLYYRFTGLCRKCLRADVEAYLGSRLNAPRTDR